MRKKQLYEAPDAELFVVRVEENILSDPQVTTDPRDDYGDEIIDLGTTILRIESFAEPFFGAAIVCYGVFVGAGSSLKITSGTIKISLRA